MGELIPFKKKEEEKEEEIIWQCGCGSTLFELRPDGFVCADCEIFHRYEDLFEQE